ncbi:19062_t:CDS:1, partial [Cetraspora pellucida]
HILDANPAPENPENETSCKKTNRLARIRYATNKYYKLNPHLIQEESQASSSTKSQTQLNKLR